MLSFLAFLSNFADLVNTTSGTMEFLITLFF
jgi:hypothetical protein